MKTENKTNDMIDYMVSMAMEFDTKFINSEKPKILIHIHTAYRTNYFRKIMEELNTHFDVYVEVEHPTLIQKNNSCGYKYITEQERIKMTFNYCVANPPFTRSTEGAKETTNGAYPAQDNNLWQKIIEKIYPKVGVITFISPKGAAGGFYKKYKRNIEKVERLNPEVFPIGHDTVRVTMSHNITPECIFEIGGGDGHPAGEYKIKTSKYPTRVPLIYNGCTLAEYDDVFDQVHGIKKTQTKNGIYRAGDVFLYGSTEKVNAYECTPEQSKIIMPKLQKLMDEGKIHGYRGRGFKDAMRDFDNIRT